MFKDLEVFKVKGQFEFKLYDQLSEVCNAPKDSCGIYLIYEDEVDYDNLIYIGISGKEWPNGEFTHSEDALWGRIVNGKQPNDLKQQTWPLIMQEREVERLIIKWYITYGEIDKVFPKPIEEAYLDMYMSEEKSLPLWNEEV